MTLPRTVADVLSQHVVFEIESIDRMYLNVFVRQAALRGAPFGDRGPGAWGSAVRSEEVVEVLRVERVLSEVVLG